MAHTAACQAIHLPQLSATDPWMPLVCASDVPHVEATRAPLYGGLTRSLGLRAINVGSVLAVLWSGESPGDAAAPQP